jgi:hypothetical protein
MNDKTHNPIASFIRLIRDIRGYINDSSEQLCNIFVLQMNYYELPIIMAWYDLYL